MNDSAADLFCESTPQTNRRSPFYFEADSSPGSLVSNGQVEHRSSPSSSFFPNEQHASASSQKQQCAAGKECSEREGERRTRPDWHGFWDSGSLGHADLNFLSPAEDRDSLQSLQQLLQAHLQAACSDDLQRDAVLSSVVSNVHEARCHADGQSTDAHGRNVTGNLRFHRAGLQHTSRHPQQKPMPHVKRQHWQPAFGMACCGLIRQKAFIRPGHAQQLL